MNTDYLGDGKDLAKGFIFNHLRNDGLIEGPFVVPFFRERISAKQLNTYADVLGVSPELVFRERPWDGFIRRRKDYLSEVASRVDCDTIFFDPDTGMRSVVNGTKCKGKYKFVSFEEIYAVAGGSDGRIVVTYDESYDNRDKTDLIGAVRRKTRAIKLSQRGEHYYAFAYVGMALNLVFVTNTTGRNRLENIKASLKQLLQGKPRRIV